MKPSAVKAASSVLNGGDEETGLVRPRLVATQLESGKYGPVSASALCEYARRWASTECEWANTDLDHGVGHPLPPCLPHAFHDVLLG